MIIRLRSLAPAFFLSVALAGLVFLLSFSKFSPAAGPDFFFDPSQPEYREHLQIGRVFPQNDKVLLGIPGNIRDKTYTERIRSLTKEVSRIPEVGSVLSLTSGPRDVNDAVESPLWNRLIVSEDRQGSVVYIYLKKNVSRVEVVKKIDRIKLKHQRPDFKITLTGDPFIIERMAAHLRNDFIFFSTILVFCSWFLSWILFRSFLSALTLQLACLTGAVLAACFAAAFRLPTGFLFVPFIFTAFFLTYMTGIWLAHQDPARSLFRVGVIFLSPVLISFAFFLLTPAVPVRRFGLLALAAFAAAVLSAAAVGRFLAERRAGNEREPEGHTMPRQNARTLIFFMLWVTLGFTGLPRLSTDPTLTGYFKKGSELREGLEFIDKSGGTTVFRMVLSDEKRKKMHTDATYERLWNLQQAIERDPAVGSVLSFPILIAQAKRIPLGAFLSARWMANLLETPFAKQVARSFVTADKEMSLYVIRIKESRVEGERREIVERMKALARSHGFVPEFSGGIFLLLALLAEQVYLSAAFLLLAAFVFFFAASLAVAPTFRTAAASSILHGVSVLGFLGTVSWLEIPLDAVSVPGLIFGTSIGSGLMLSFLHRVRRYRAWGVPSHEAWPEAVKKMRDTSLALVLCCALPLLFAVTHFPSLESFGLLITVPVWLHYAAAFFVLPAMARREPAYA